VKEAKALIAQAQQCTSTWQRVLARGDPNEMRSFARVNAKDCPEQVAQAEQAAKEAEVTVARAACASSWRAVRYSSRASDFYAFVRGHQDCNDELAEAEQRIGDLFESCMSNAQREAAASPQRGIDAYQRCRADFGSDSGYALQIVKQIEELKSQTNAVRQFDIYRNIDFAGDDIIWIKNQSLEGCEAACRTMSQCKAFTFNTGKNVCILKSGYGTPSPHSEAISGAYTDGPPVNIQSAGEIDIKWGVDYPGGDYYDRRYISLNECSNLCRGDAQCVGFSYVPSKQWCWLKSSLGNFKRDSKVVSGTKY
jgi:hypothetical protein